MKGDICPLLQACIASDVASECMGEKCAWFVPHRDGAYQSGECALFFLGRRARGPQQEESHCEPCPAYISPDGMW